LVGLVRPLPVIETGKQVTGQVVAVDRFGNLTTNIEPNHWASLFPDGCLDRALFRVGRRIVHGLSTAYSQATPGEPLAIINSRGVVEIAVNGGHAARALQIGMGDPIVMQSTGGRRSESA
jgi:S-adenosylmethionine hydrolase